MTRPRPRCFLSLFHAYVCASIKTFKNEDGDFPLTFKTSGQSWPLIVIPISFQTDVPLKGSKLSPWTKPPLHSEGGMLRTRGRLAQEGWWGAPTVHPHSSAPDPGLSPFGCLMGISNLMQQNQISPQARSSSLGHHNQPGSCLVKKRAVTVSPPCQLLTSLSGAVI